MDVLFSLYNTETKKKEIFIPIDVNGQKVTIYSCGPTVYAPPHIGNMRAYVSADILNRTLRYLGYIPKHIINITDVGHLVSDADTGEDKIEVQAKKIKMVVKDIIEKYTNAFFDDLEMLHVQTDHYIFPRATEYVPQQIEFIREIEKKGLSYATSDGIYFDTSLFKRYGTLGQVIREDDRRARIELTSKKKNIADFALWKFSGTPGIRQQEWESPWGLGFPGWHIECSTMAMEILGKQIDIHTGGIDHIPIHHNNEIAQSESITGKKFVKHWVHTAFLTINGEKVSKSLDNTYTLTELIQKKYSPLAFRYLCLLTSHHTPLAFSFESLDAGSVAYETLRKIVSMWSIHGHMPLNRLHGETISLFTSAIADDLNTAKALSEIWKMVRNENISLEVKQATLRNVDAVLGLGLNNNIAPPPQDVLDIAKERDVKRKAKDFFISDSLRADIEKRGFGIVDEEQTSYLYTILPQNNT